MKVTIEVEFDVEGQIEDVTEDQAKAAATTAAFDHLALTENGIDVVDDPENVVVHIEGYGSALVKLVGV